MDFVIIANAWRASVDNPTSKHQIALELAKQGHRVLWVEGAGMRVPKISSGTDRARIIAKLKKGFAPAVEAARNIWRIAPLVFPFPASAVARALNAGIYVRAMHKNMKKLGFENAVLVNFVPVVPGVFRSWPGRKVYYCVDRWDQFNMYDSEMMAKVDEACCRNADLVIASAGDLYERCRELNPNTHLVTHGVDYEHFAGAVTEDLPRPGDLPEGKIVGFFGLLSEWVDQDLLVRLAAELTDAQIVLIGKADVPIDKLKNIVNIHILGPKPFAELPAYVVHFDVGIIPFIVNDLTRAVNPIKLREMLAAGCPVVSTDLPEVERLGGAQTAEKGTIQHSTRLREHASPRQAFNTQHSSVDAVHENGSPTQERTHEHTHTLTHSSDSGFPPKADPPLADKSQVSSCWVLIAHTHDEFIRHVKGMLDRPLTNEERRLISESMKEETWEAKVREILRVVA
jgi:glycosyltransferase involved in cell wall biosynthesis